MYFLTIFLYIWPLAGPNSAKKGGAVAKWARDELQAHFGTFDFLDFRGISSRDQVGCQRSLQEAQIQGRKLQGGAGRRLGWRATDSGHSPGASFPGFGASSRLDHGLKFYVIPGGCASSRLIDNKNYKKESQIIKEGVR